jgi:sarcosine oxidase/L-pipecolate oxidase
MPSCVVVGAGVFGASTAIELLSRGWTVTLVDPNLATPHDRLSSSDDVSKIIRGDYGADQLYFDLHCVALERWRALQARWRSDALHWTGVGFVTQRESAAGFERASVETLRRSALPAAAVLASSREVGARFPGLNRGARTFEWGYFNPNGGWAESSRVLSLLLEDCSAAARVARPAAELLRGSSGNGVVGVRLADGECLYADWTVVACGAWTRFLVPESRGLLRANAMPVFHFERPPGAALPSCPVTLDISQTGFYMFPPAPPRPGSGSNGIIKVGHHGLGRALSEPASRASLEALALEMRDAEEARFRAFLAQFVPDLARAPVRRFLLCQYCDAHDGDFLIARVPGRDGLAVASGGSGHGFKFAPVVGEIAADVLEGRENPRPVMRAAAKRFAWRTPLGPQEYDVARAKI